MEAKSYEFDGLTLGELRALATETDALVMKAADDGDFQLAGLRAGFVLEFYWWKDWRESKGLCFSVSLCVLVERDRERESVDGRGQFLYEPATVMGNFCCILWNI